MLPKARIPLLLVCASALAVVSVASAGAADPVFKGKIAPSAKDSVPHWPDMPKAPKDAPNILIILLDDIGFGDTSSFGGLAETPALDRIAASGLRYNNFNVTAMCSPTRAALLTGRNHHRVGFAAITEYANGYPGHDSYWKQSTASVAQVLSQNGYRTAAIGKWHNTPEWEISQAGPFDRWPTSLGFDYFYGFMGAEDNQWEPDRLYLGTTPIEAPRVPGETYHLTKDLTDKAITWLQTHRSLASETPWFLYLAPGGVHTPHHAPKPWIERFKGRYDEGWDVLRQEIFTRQKRLGVVPADAVLTPRPASIPAWNSLSDDQRRLYARQMEVYAGYVAYTDHEVGRLVEHVRAAPGGDNTLIVYVVGDNGALGMNLPNYGDSATLQEDLSRIDKLGGPEVPFNHYQDGWGWMGNTPFQYWKSIASHFGGLRAPLIISWPARFAGNGALRSQFAHVTDIVPTLYDAIGISQPTTLNGVAQQALDGVSLVPGFASADTPSAHHTQYFELLGNRGLYHKGWMASALNALNAPSGGGDVWELYHVEKDFSQARNLAASHPGKLAELKALFDREAWANNVYPLGGAAYPKEAKPFAINGKSRFDYFQGPDMIPHAQLPSMNLGFSLEADVTIPAEGGSGVLASYGHRNKGFAWYIEDGRMVFENRAGVRGQRLVTAAMLAPGKHLLRYQFACETCEGPGRQRKPISGTARLFVDDTLVAEQRLEGMNLAFGGENLSMNIGRAGGSTVSTSYQAPFPFTGTLERLTISLD
jgi:arylsulfatase